MSFWALYKKSEPGDQYKAQKNQQRAVRFCGSPSELWWKLRAPSKLRTSQRSCRPATSGRGRGRCTRWEHHLLPEQVPSAVVGSREYCGFLSFCLSLFICCGVCCSFFLFVFIYSHSPFDLSLSLSMRTCMCIYIDMYTYISLCICIFIHMYRYDQNCCL